MSISFQLDYADDQEAQAAVTHLRNIHGCEAITVKRSGDSVQVGFDNPLLEGASLVCSGIVSAYTAIRERLPGFAGDDGMAASKS